MGDAPTALSMTRFNVGIDSFMIPFLNSLFLRTKMPLVLKRNINPHTLLSIWEMNEALDFFLQSGIFLPKTLQNNKRKREWIASRLLLRVLAPNTTISYNEFGAPILSDGRAISITHSNDYCCLLISPNKASIDLELITEKAHRLKKKFVSEEEEKLLTQSDRATLAWCAKECLFKLHQKGKIIFKEDLHLKSFTPNTIETTLNGDPYLLNYEKFKGHYLVYYYE